MTEMLGGVRIFAYICGMKRIITILAACAVSAAVTIPARAENADGSGSRGDSIAWRVTAIGGGASRDFNPYLLAWDNYGLTPMGAEALSDVAAGKDLDLGRRFSWAAGAEFVSGYTGKAGYRYVNHSDVAPGVPGPDVQPWYSHSQGMPAVWVQQLYAAVKYRGLYAEAGMRQRSYGQWGGGVIVDNSLSSGDLVQGTSARPGAQVRAGFVDFQNFPGTRGWLQISGCLSYGKMADADYLKNHYNYWNDHITLGSLYTYKNIYFRSNPAKPLSVTIGVQSAALFGGTRESYVRGSLMSIEKYERNLKAFWKMLVPFRNNGDNFYEGSSLGSWDLRARYRFAGGSELSGYFQWLWEDGSSMGRRNKWDGLWGVEYRRRGRGLLQAAVLEYLDFRDQSGPMHWAPGDFPGTDLTAEATGGDDYYNNAGMNGFSHFGMSLGSPFVVAPIYNTDGFLQFRHTRMQGVHAAAKGWLAPTVSWRAAVSWSRARGSGRHHTAHALNNTAAMVQANWDASCLTRGLSASAAMAFDAGRLRGNNFGMLFTVSYGGILGF